MRLLILDYLGRVRPERSQSRSENREQQVAQQSAQAKDIADELGIPFVLLTQLNREYARDNGTRGKADPRRPQLSDLQESGAIEQDADTVLFLHRPYVRPRTEAEAYRAPETELIVAKQRNGPIPGVVPRHHRLQHDEEARLVGHRRPKARPSSEWVRVPAPNLRIVSDEAWEAAHARLTQSRGTYLRTQGGRLWGRPPSGLAGRYLLTGLARCGVCGAGLEVRSRKSGQRRLFYYSCSSFYRRGASVCANRYEIPMDTANAAVVGALLDEVLTTDDLSTVVELGLDRLAVALEAPGETRGQLERQLGECEGALARLTAAVAAGGDVPSLVDAIKVQDAQRRTLERRLEALAAPAVTFDRTLEKKLAAAVTEWRAALGQHVTIARQVLNKCLAGKLTFTPTRHEGRQDFRFQGVSTWKCWCAGSCPGVCRRWRPQLTRVGTSWRAGCGQSTG